MKKSKLWLLRVWNDVEPEVVGPFRTDAARLKLARKIRAEHGDKDGLFRMECNERPRAGSFGGGELAVEESTGRNESATGEDAFEGRDICSVCDKDFEYGTLQDITEEGFELICPDCIRKKLEEHGRLLGGTADAVERRTEHILLWVMDSLCCRENVSMEARLAVMKELKYQHPTYYTMMLAVYKKREKELSNEINNGTP